MKQMLMPLVSFAVLAGCSFDGTQNVFALARYIP
jgi:uncharacterized lipoprotein YajG